VGSTSKRREGIKRGEDRGREEKVKGVGRAETKGEKKEGKRETRPLN